MKLLSQNSELRKDGIWCWTIPALSTKLESGSFVTCPNAGSCAQFCYARNGTYNFPAVREAHRAKLERLLADPTQWVEDMVLEIQSKRSIPYLRIHDAGDFFARWYLECWFRVARRCPNTTFYCYTKEVSMFKMNVEHVPSNFKYLFSMGGKQGCLIDRERDRHAEVFPSMEALLEAGYSDQSGSDILAITLPTNKIGIVANNIPHFKKKMGDRTFGSVQLEMYSRQR